MMHIPALSAVLVPAATLLLAPAAPAGDAAPLQVCATVTDLAALVREVGGDAVSVTVFTPAVGDPHFQEPRPSFIKAMSRADLYVQVGLELEIGWAPKLWESARNPRVQPGGQGFLDASSAIEPLEVPGTGDRSMGDVHPQGNPHYLLDPLDGLRVAGAIARTLSSLRPERKAYFEGRLADFRGRLGTALVGEKLAKKYDFEKLAVLHERGKLVEFLRSQKDDGLLEGWLGFLASRRGENVVADHTLWPYFARRFGLEVAGYMEPRPGVPPTTKHLRELVETMKKLGVKAILASPYYDLKHAEFLAGATGARIARMAHQTGSVGGAEGYLETVDHNVKALVEALK